MDSALLFKTIGYCFYCFLENFRGKSRFGGAPPCPPPIAESQQGCRSILLTMPNLEHSRLIDCTRQLYPGALCVGIYKRAQSY